MREKQYQYLVFILHYYQVNSCTKPQSQKLNNLICKNKFALRALEICCHVGVFESGTTHGVIHVSTLTPICENPVKED